MNPDFTAEGWRIELRESRTDELRACETDAYGFYVFEGLAGPFFDVFLEEHRNVGIFDRWGRGMVEPTGLRFFDVFFDGPVMARELNFVLDDETLTDIEGEGISEEIPIEYTLEVNYPNPFNPTTRIEYSMPEIGHVRLDVFDMLGRLVTTLVDSVQPAGQYGVTFDAGRLPSGLYQYRMTAGSFVQTNRMLLMK